MIVAEDETVHLVSLFKFRSEFIKRFFLTLEDIFFVAGEAVAARPTVSEAEGQPWMQEAEQELKDSVMEDGTEETVSARHGAETVAVTEAEHLTADLHKSWLLKTFHTKFLEIAVCPHIVVTLEEIHINSPVHQCSQRCKDPYIPLRNDVTVFIPEVPDITKEIQCCRFLRQRAEKIDETGFTGNRIVNPEAEMNIGDEVCVFGSHKVSVYRLPRSHGSRNDTQDTIMRI